MDHDSHSHTVTPAGIRRKRTDEDNNSSGSSATGIDSMRPVVPASHRRKRRRTILNAFQSISLQQHVGDDDEDADSSQAVAEYGAGEHSSTSSLEDDYDHAEDDDGDARFLSDREETERKVMLELVFGPGTKGTRATDPVERKLTTLIRKTMNGESRPPSASTDMSMDDTTVETAYSRSSTRSNPRSLRRTNSLPIMEALDESDDMEM